MAGRKTADVVVLPPLVRRQPTRRQGDTPVSVAGGVVGPRNLERRCDIGPPSAHKEVANRRRIRRAWGVPRLPTLRLVARSEPSGLAGFNHGVTPCPQSCFLTRHTVN